MAKSGFTYTPPRWKQALMESQMLQAADESLGEGSKALAGGMGSFGPEARAARAARTQKAKAEGQIAYGSQRALAGPGVQIENAGGYAEPDARYLPSGVIKEPFEISKAETPAASAPVFAPAPQAPAPMGPLPWEVPGLVPPEAYAAEPSPNPMAALAAEGGPTEATLPDPGGAQRRSLMTDAVQPQLGLTKGLATVKGTGAFPKAQAPLPSLGAGLPVQASRPGSLPSGGALDGLPLRAIPSSSSLAGSDPGFADRQRLLSERDQLAGLFALTTGQPGVFQTLTGRAEDRTQEDDPLLMRSDLQKILAATGDKAALENLRGEMATKFGLSSLWSELKAQDKFRQEKELEGLQHPPTKKDDPATVVRELNTLRTAKTLDDLYRIIAENPITTKAGSDAAVAREAWLKRNEDAAAKTKAEAEEAVSPHVWAKIMAVDTKEELRKLLVDPEVQNSRGAQKAVEKMLVLFGTDLREAGQRALLEGRLGSGVQPRDIKKEAEDDYNMALQRAIDKGYARKAYGGRIRWSPPKDAASMPDYEAVRKNLSDAEARINHASDESARVLEERKRQIGGVREAGVTKVQEPVTDPQTEEEWADYLSEVPDEQLPEAEAKFNAWKEANTPRSKAFVSPGTPRNAPFNRFDPMAVYRKNMAAKASKVETDAEQAEIAKDREKKKQEALRRVRESMPRYSPPRETSWPLDVR